ncbi:MAG: hypothetical protein ACKOQ8_07730 [Micrococcales bacterium]
MSYSTTTRLSLKKAVIGTNQPFETAVFNENLDKIDAEAVAADLRLDTLEAANTTNTGAISSLTTRVTAVEGVNTTQNSRLTTAEGSITSLTNQVTSGTVNNASKVGGRTIFVGSGTPTGAVAGDIWIQV